MSQHQITASGFSQASRGPFGFVSHILGVLWVWQFRYKSRRQLEALDLHMCKDIGVEPSEATRESMKPFWQA
ncbi:MAG: DUF1127 domain-containing protein [Pseudomonadota bacterium]